MQHSKFLITALLFAFLLPGVGLAQTVIVSSANPGAWSVDETAGQNAAPVSAAFLNGLAYPFTPITYTGCININNNPAAQMTIPNPPAGDNCGSNNRTRYYMTNVQLSNTNTCYNASFRIRADDVFRVYVNGTQVAGALTLNGCSGTNMAQLNGNNWGTAYTFNNIQPLLVLGQNTVVIEVANCAVVSYLSAVLTFQPLSAIPTANQIHSAITQNPPTGYVTSLWGINPKTMKTLGYNGMWMGNWLIESGPTQTGPWTTFATNTENTSTQLAPWNPSMFSYGTYYRVTYTITTSCGNTATYTQMIFICQGCLAPGGPVEDRESAVDLAEEVPEGIPAVRTEISDISSFLNYQDSTSVSYSDMIQSAYVDHASDLLVINVNEKQENAQVQVYSIQGKLMWANKSPQVNFNVDISDWQEGIYIVHASDNGKVGVPKKVIILRE